ncbi:hypothetical protein GUJ93_ZPchr0013g36705 [Zizania palustris]|uniref:Uncharacterized protein n=1 Tax=Zizania palustris TaxID=103762 RepID=A0A8J5WY31_ZIZPA|nr:hypothetical protein GUJ93_ZPchr0013g36705 [Zizania palustris]
MHTSMLVRWQAAGKQGGWSTEHDTLILSKLQEQSATSRAQVHKEVSREAIVAIAPRTTIRLPLLCCSPHWFSLPPHLSLSYTHTHMHGPSQKHAFWILVWSSTCNFDL